MARWTNEVVYAAPQVKNSPCNRLQDYFIMLCNLNHYWYRSILELFCRIRPQAPFVLPDLLAWGALFKRLRNMGAEVRSPPR